MRKRYIQINGELIEAEKVVADVPQTTMIMPDIQPYQSMIDGSMINSRSEHRAHLKAHGCVEVGNDSSLKNTQAPPIQSPPGLKEAIARQVYQKLRY